MAHELALTAVGTSAAAARMGAPPPTSLAPGFRFHPTDEELVVYYLRRRACGEPFRFQVVTELDVYKSEPWELPGQSPLKSLQWYFFSPVDRKHGNGHRLNRATRTGYWKASGKDRTVLHENQIIGMKKTLIFYSGRTPNRQRTNWVMHEYRLCDPELETVEVVQDAFVLCKIFEKSGLGPRNGDHYALFVEEEWDEEVGLVEDKVTNDDEVVFVHYTNADQDNRSLSIAPPNLELPLEPKENNSTIDPLTFDSSNLEKHVPHEYFKFINNLENERVKVSMEKEALKIELLRAQAMINTLQSHVQILSRDDEEVRIHV